MSKKSQNFSNYIKSAFETWFSFPPYYSQNSDVSQHPVSPDSFGSCELREDVTLPISIHDGSLSERECDEGMVQSWHFVYM
ncbi:hypothetical protein K7432_016642 [Basidiobolus ranarum]|uniref:Uncharacterized protein n=1 Tax=Basidiobolus ranarum TaxID=34480 RepID=A0ABR2WEF0_9FUNG